MFNIDSYFKYAIENKLIHKWLWVISLLGIREEGIVNEYVKIEDGVGYVKIDDVFVVVDTYSKNKAFITIADTVTIPAGMLESHPGKLTTTVGVLIANYLLLEVPFKGVIGYINENGSMGEIIELFKDKFSSGEITVEQYRKFVLSCTYLQAFNKLVTPSITEKLMVPPPGLKKFKAELDKQFDTKYGTDWGKDPTRIVAYDNLLKAYYDDYVKDDPSYGILANKKNRNNALSKKYLTFSATNAFGEQVHIKESLSDGYPKDPDKLAAMFNTARSASYSRGAETQKGGAVAKSVLRATSSIQIVPGDCGVKYGKHTVIRDNMLGTYIIINRKLVLLDKDSIKTYLNEIHEVRTAMYCIAKRPTLCSVCIGDKASGHPNGVSLIVTNVSSVLTTAALKAMHNTQISTTKVSLGDILS